MKIRAPERPLLRHPAQVIVVAFGTAVIVGTLLLMLPVSRVSRTARRSSPHSSRRQRGVRDRVGHGGHAAGRLTHVVEADTTDEEAMRQLSMHEFTRAVIGIGNDLEASILSASVLLKLGVRDIWAKAISDSHARILSQIGVHHVVRPEHDMGKRVAHLVRGRMLDYIEFDDGYAIVKTRPPR